MLSCGTYFIIGSYVYILGFDKMGIDITESAAPLNDLAKGAGVSFLRYVIDLGIAIGFIAVTVAALTAVSRILFNMSREGLVPRALGEVDETHRVPKTTLLVVGVFVTVTVVVSQIAGLTPVDILGYYGSIATYGFIVAYLVVSLAASATCDGSASSSRSTWSRRCSAPRRWARSSTTPCTRCPTTRTTSSRTCSSRCSCRE